MTTEHFTQVDFENYGPIKKASLKLTRLHALIGPNDAGKSSALLALRLLNSFVDGTPSRVDLQRTTEGSVVRGRKGKFELTASFVEHGWQIEYRRGSVTTSKSQIQETGDWSGTRMVRFDPDELSKATPLLPDTKPLELDNERGAGLGAALDAIFSRNVRQYIAIEDQLRLRFPSVDGFRLFTSPEGRSVGVRLVDGTELPTEALSEGLLYFLAFTVLPLLRPVSTVLVEEPENGLHPSRIAEVVRVLRDLSKTTQVVIATHSPLVINELQPEEVTLVTRTPTHGTKFTPIAETPNFKERSSVYALGELWLSYADGKTEAALLAPTGTK